jgi:hypothetical protein
MTKCECKNEHECYNCSSHQCLDCALLREEKLQAEVEKLSKRQKEDEAAFWEERDARVKIQAEVETWIERSDQTLEDNARLRAEVGELEKTVDQEINARLEALGQVEKLKGYLEWCAFHVNLPSRKTYDMIYEEGLRAKAKEELSDHPVHKVFNAVFPEGET